MGHRRRLVYQVHKAPANKSRSFWVDFKASSWASRKARKRGTLNKKKNQWIGLWGGEEISKGIFLLEKLIDLVEKLWKERGKMVLCRKRLWWFPVWLLNQQPLGRRVSLLTSRKKFLFERLCSSWKGQTRSRWMKRLFPSSFPEKRSFSRLWFIPLDWRRLRVDRWQLLAQRSLRGMKRGPSDLILY